MTSRRQFTLAAAMVCFGGRYGNVFSQGSFCASFTNGTVRYCDDQRATTGQAGAPSAPPLSPSPWRTWSTEQLRQWDADVARWGNVRQSTYNAVQSLAASLPDVNPNTGEKYADLKAAISGALRDVAGAVINNTIPEGREAERFWRELSTASDGWQRLRAVSKAEALGQYTGLKPDLSSFLHPNGLIRSASTGDPLADISFSAGRTPNAFERSVVNSLEFTRGVLSDALEVAGSNYAARAARASETIILVEVLLISSLVRPAGPGPMLAFAQKVVNDVASYFEGLAAGALQGAGAIIDFIANLVISPIETIAGIADAVWPLDDFLVSIFEAVVSDIKKFVLGSPYERGVLVGNFVVGLLTAELGAAAATRLGGTALGARIGAAYVSLGDIAAASWLVKKARLAVAYVAEVRAAFEHELRSIVRVGETPSRIAGLEAKILEAEVLEGFALYPDEAALPQKLKDLLRERNAVISDTNQLIDEAAKIAINGRYSSLDEVRATIDRIATESGLDGNAFHYADERLAKAFEQVKARQVKGIWDYYDPPKGTPGARQFDVKSETELIQCSMKEFKSSTDITDWLANPRIVRQVDATVETAKRLAIEPTYWFRWQPPAEVVEALKGRGITNVRWDLPPR